MTDTSLTHEQLSTREDWANEMGQRWLSYLDSFEGMIAPIGKALLKRAAFKPDERVVDLGCGGGATTIAIAQAVAPTGEVVGLDISPDLVAHATRRAADAGASNARFVCADASTATLDAKFDRLFSRFGSMFFDEPYAAFANLHNMLKPGARIDLAAWASPKDNPWIRDVTLAAKNHLDIPTPEPRAPGPFAFEDTDYLTDILKQAGFSAIDIVGHMDMLAVGGAGKSPDQVAEFLMGATTFGSHLVNREPELSARVRQDITELLQVHYRPGEGVMMGAKAWLVSARA